MKKKNNFLNFIATSLQKMEWEFTEATDIE